MSKTTNKFSPEVRERAVRMVSEHRTDHWSEWDAMVTLGATPKQADRYAELVPGFWLTRSVTAASADRPRLSPVR